MKFFRDNGSPMFRMRRSSPWIWKSVIPGCAAAERSGDPTNVQPNFPCQARAYCAPRPARHFVSSLPALRRWFGSPRSKERFTSIFGKCFLRNTLAEGLALLRARKGKVCCWMIRFDSSGAGYAQCALVIADAKDRWRIMLAPALNPKGALDGQNTTDGNGLPELRLREAAEGSA